MNRIFISTSSDTALLEKTLDRQMQEAGIANEVDPSRLNIEHMQSRSQADLDRIRHRLAALAAG